MSSKEIQQAIVEAIKNQLPADQNPAELLASILNLNKNAVYKRLSGQTQLSLEDLAILSNHFQISFDKIFYPGQPHFQVLFSGFEARKSSLEYIKNLESDLMQLSQLTNPHIKYVSIGLPDFYFFLFDEMTLFQIFTWERLTWNNPDWQAKKFSLGNGENEQFLKMTRRLANLYGKIKVTEFWSEYVLDNFYQQLTYVVESKLYDRKEDIFKLLETSEQLIDHLKIMARRERRYSPNGNPGDGAAPLHIYYNETMKSNIMLLIECEEIEMVYAVVDNPNFIKTTDPQMVAHTRKVFEKLMKRAIPLGEQGERYRDVYFDKLIERYHYFKEKILSMLG
ncbi:MAG: hypothetical protein AAFZ15_30370 [Bacteroidota bacterium]